MKLKVKEIFGYLMLFTVIITIKQTLFFLNNAMTDITPSSKEQQKRAHIFQEYSKITIRRRQKLTNISH